jgi:hypothetical protein
MTRLSLHSTRRPLHQPTTHVPDHHLEGLARLLQAALPAFTARDGDRAGRDRILPIAEGLLRGREAIRQGAHGRVRGRQHLLAAILHVAHVAFEGQPSERLAALLRTQRHRLSRPGVRHRRPWLEAPPRHHYDRALTQAVSLAYEIDRPDRRSPHRLRAQAADLANYVLFYLVLTDALDALQHPSAAPS